MTTANRPPIFAILAIQAVVFGGLYLAMPTVNALVGYGVPLFWQMSAQGLIAATVTKYFKFGWGWVIGQCVAPPLVILALGLGLPMWIYPVILILLVLVFWNVASNRVPLYLTNTETSAALLKLLPNKKSIRFVDLGSGLGGTLRYLASRSPESRFYGVESAPLPFIFSWCLRKLHGKDNLEFRFRDIWKEDLSEFDVVYCFLSPVPMARLFAKAQEELKPGSLFISNSFAVPDQKPDKIITVKDGRKTQLLIWKI
ncbi:class I SAM-dependent methyltransferase [Sneathiella marina]|uniref:Class I SAM-dependent methyltransferase n=1 Tax=Sneathiella marina TaxID=2950108 RepID=A0ABY4W638_9PROT|nr:class I SAM-dependent methyltransferase [Sneathiella marina]USG60116.1 class I SAM-dependent methyltransferase [Sneathiella marina]